MKFLISISMLCLRMAVDARSFVSSVLPCKQSENMKPPTNGKQICHFPDPLGNNGVCLYSCNTGYLMKGENFSICRGSEWNGNPPKCVICDESRAADVVIAVDASVGEENFERAQNFANDFVESLTSQENSYRFSLFQFGDNGVFEANYTYMQLRSLTPENYPYLPEVEVVDFPRENITKFLLQQIGNVVLVEGNGDRPDVQNIVIVVVNQLPNVNDLVEPSRKLGKKTKVFFVGLNKETSTEISELPPRRSKNMYYIQAKEESINEQLFLNYIKTKVCECEYRKD